MQTNKKKKKGSKQISKMEMEVSRYVLRNKSNLATGFLSGYNPEQL